MNNIGSISKINGPIIEAKDMHETIMLEVVEVGEDRLIGEVIKLREDIATIQVYEDTSGLKPGENVYCTGRPLSVKLGPGLIGSIFDGIQRPLKAIAEKSGAFIKRGEKVPPLDEQKQWHFVPEVSVGDQLSGGQIFGTLKETELIDHRVLIPPDVEQGTVVSIKEEGDYCLPETVCTVETDDSGKRELPLFQYWPARKARPYKQRLVMTEPLITGMRIIDTFFPIPKGGAAAIPGGFGTGKTMTQHSLAKWSDSDIIVYIGCGERGNEMTDVLTEFPKLTDPKSGRPLMERTILIANTSNMPVAAREVSIYTGVTIAEYYRDMGYHVAIMADSTSRWAEALRELSGRLEEMPADEGFPAYLPSKLAQFYERAGRIKTLNERSGSVSIIGAVSPPGGDFSEPVTQHTKRFIRCFWALDKELANARHYPSISWLNSYSEYYVEITDWWKKIESEWSDLREQAMEILQKENKLQQIVKLVGPDALPDTQRLVLFVADLIKNAFLQQNAFDKIDMYTVPQKQIMMIKILLTIHERGLQIIRKGAPIIKIRELPILNKVVRMKSQIPNDDLSELKNLSFQVDQELNKLEHSYR